MRLLVSECYIFCVNNDNIHSLAVTFWSWLNKLKQSLRHVDHYLLEESEHFNRKFAEKQYK